jgi:hypothetical protein
MCHHDQGILSPRARAHAQRPSLCMANRISLCTCEKAAENGAFGSCFRHPFHRTPTRASGRFNLFLGPGAPSAQRASTAEPLLIFSTSTLTHPSHLPPSLEGPILAPRAQSLK